MFICEIQKAGHPHHKRLVRERLLVAEMRVSSLLALFLSSVVYTAAVLQPVGNAGTPSINASSVPAPLPNATQLLNATELGMDPRFAIAPEAGSEFINGISTYMNTIRLLSILALGDFDGQLASAESVSQAPWSDVNITVATVDNTRPLERRFAIWGLFQSVYYLAQGGFTDCIINLYYDRQPVGLVRFRLTAAGGASDGSSSTSWNSTSLNSTDADLEAAITGRIRFAAEAQDLPQASVYLMLCLALTRLAEEDSDDRMTKIAFDLAQYDTSLDLSSVTRRVEPYMTVADALAGVYQVAREVTRQQRYAEFTGLIRVERSLIGIMDVHKGPPSSSSSAASPAALQGPDPAASAAAVDTA